MRWPAVAAVADRRFRVASLGDRGSLLQLLLFGVALTLPVAAAPAPAIFQSAPGHFEVAAIEAGAAEAVATQAEEGWRCLAGPLALPERFSTPIFVRLVPAADWSGGPPFRVIVEAGGVVSLRVRWSAQTPDFFLKRALVQALLMRLAVSQHGVNEKLAAPLWLELGAVGWWQTRADAAQLDALKQESSRFDPPALTDILGWQRGAGESRSLTVGALWFFTWVQAESDRAGEWSAMLRRLLGGEESSGALAASFPGRFTTGADRELWWQTGWHHLRRGRTLPTLGAVESREGLAALTRFVFAIDGRDVVTPLGEVLTHAREPIVDAEWRRRAAELTRLMPALHPFYRNAGLSLAEALASRGVADGARVAAFERDWNDARELEIAARAALDALEKR